MWVCQGRKYSSHVVFTFIDIGEGEEQKRSEKYLCSWEPLRYRGSPITQQRASTVRLGNVRQYLQFLHL
ncbi:hypothetical protein NIES3974_27660 [Calothrix sp. NIES-3974]|nr:hypothetical protein NIES3974_27660 [Calothrix sp. NIES-3974]